MARLYPLRQCLDTSRGILFDTSTLIDLYGHEEVNGAPSPLLLEIQPRRRYTSIINVFEFVCNRARGDVRNRRAWLQDKDIKPLPVTKEISTTFVSLVGETVGCHLRNDLLVAATAKRETLAVASGDDNFRDIDGILWVAEFAPKG